MNPRHDVPLEDGNFTFAVPDKLRVQLERRLTAKTVRLMATITPVDDPTDTREYHVRTSQVDWKTMEWGEMFRKSGIKAVKKDLGTLAIDRTTRHSIIAYLLGKFQAPPPLNAEFLFYLFLDAKNCDALVGDLEERHKLIRKKFGRRRANLWYWTQAILSVGPIAWSALKEAMKRLWGLAALLEFYRKIRH